jgi:hypothetical protein
LSAGRSYFQNTLPQLLWWLSHPKFVKCNSPSELSYWVGEVCRVLNTKESVPSKSSKSNSTPAGSVVLDSWCFGAFLHCWFIDVTTFDDVSPDEYHTAEFIKTCKMALFILTTSLGGVCSIDPAIFLKYCSGTTVEQVQAKFAANTQLEATCNTLGNSSLLLLVF